MHSIIEIARGRLEACGPVVASLRTLSPPWNAEAKALIQAEARAHAGRLMAWVDPNQARTDEDWAIAARMLVAADFMVGSISNARPWASEIHETLMAKGIIVTAQAIAAGKPLTSGAPTDAEALLTRMRDHCLAQVGDEIATCDQLAQQSTDPGWRRAYQTARGYLRYAEARIGLLNVHEWLRGLK